MPYSNVSLDDLPPPPMSGGEVPLSDLPAPHAAPTPSKHESMYGLPIGMAARKLSEPFIGLGEAGLTAITGMGGGIAGGLEQAAASLYEGLHGASGTPGGDPDMPHKFGEEVASSMTYQPRTETGKKLASVMTELGVPFQKVAEFLREHEKSMTGGTYGTDIGLGLLSAASPFAVSKGVGAAKTGIAKKQAALDIQKGEMAVRDATLKRFIDSGYEIPRRGRVGELLDRNIGTRNEAHATRRIAADSGIPAGKALSEEVLREAEIPHFQAYNSMVQSAGKTLYNVAQFNKKMSGLAGELRANIQYSPVAAKNLKESLKIIEEQIRPAHDSAKTMKLIQRFRDDAKKTLKNPSASLSSQEAAYTKMTIANELEGLFEANIDPKIVSNFREARTQLAKINDIRDVVDPLTGTIDMKELARISNTRPLTGELKNAADFASEFNPSARQGLSFYDAAVSGAMAAAGHPVSAAGHLAYHAAGGPTGRFPRTIPSYEVSATRKYLPNALTAMGALGYAGTSIPQQDKKK